MDETNPVNDIHFSKKILLISVIFLLCNLVYFALRFSGGSEVAVHPVAPEISFLGTSDVKIKGPYDADFHVPKAGQALMAGTDITTAPVSYAEILIDGNTVRLDENTDVVLAENDFSAESIASRYPAPRLVLDLKKGSVWLNSFDAIEVRTPQGSATFRFSVGSVTYAAPLNRMLVVRGAMDLKLKNPQGEPLAAYTLPTHSQATFVDSQLIADYARLQPSKLKKELKIGPISASALDDTWVKQNMQADRTRFEDEVQPLFSDRIYQLDDFYFRVAGMLSFLPQARAVLDNDHAQTILSYLMGAVQKSGDRTTAKDLIAQYDALTAPLHATPEFTRMAAKLYNGLGVVPFDSPAYALKNYLRPMLVSTDDPEFLRTYMPDIEYAIVSEKGPQAEKLTSEWLDHWTPELATAHFTEFENQTRLLQGVVNAYAGAVTDQLMASLDQSGKLRMDVSPNKDETLFVVTEERLDTTSALLAAYRYLDAKHYLKNSYDSLNIDSMPDGIAAKDVFLQRAKLIAQRIDYAVTNMHGSAQAIDETAFRDYISRSKRDEALSQNLKAFLEGDAAAPVAETVTPIVSPEEAVSKLAQYSVSALGSDLTADPVSPSSFQVKEARLLERAKDGSSIVFSGTYDYSTNSFSDVMMGGQPVNGSFGLTDLALILKDIKNTQGAAPSAPAPPVDSSFAGLIGQEDEAARQQLLAADLAIQLAIKELASFGIRVDSALNVTVADPATLTQFKVSEARIDDPETPGVTLVFSMTYSTQTKKVTDIMMADGPTPSLGPTDVSLFPSALRSALKDADAKSQALDTIKQLMSSNQLTLDPSAIVFENGGFDRFSFTGMTLSTLPVSAGGTYDLTQNVLFKAENPLLTKENVSLEAYFTELARLAIVDSLKQAGIMVTAANIQATYPFDTIFLTDVSQAGEKASFTFDLKKNVLTNVSFQPSDKTFSQMTPAEFKAWAPPAPAVQPPAATTTTNTTATSPSAPASHGPRIPTAQ